MERTSHLIGFGDLDGLRYTGGDAQRRTEPLPPSPNPLLDFCLSAIAAAPLPRATSRYSNCLTAAVAPCAPYSTLW